MVFTARRHTPCAPLPHSPSVRNVMRTRRGCCGGGKRPRTTAAGARGGRAVVTATVLTWRNGHSADVALVAREGGEWRDGSDQRAAGGGAREWRRVCGGTASERTVACDAREVTRARVRVDSPSRNVVRDRSPTDRNDLKHVALGLGLGLGLGKRPFFDQPPRHRLSDVRTGKRLRHTSSVACDGKC